MTAARHDQDTIVYLLLTLPTRHKADPNAQDSTGNTALHYASAYGALRVIRTLLAHGANPLLRNHYSWTPISYSSTVQAEVYFKNLVVEIDRRRTESARKDVSTPRGGGAGAGAGAGGGGGGGVRLVSEPSPSGATSNPEEDWGSPGRRRFRPVGDPEGDPERRAA